MLNMNLALKQKRLSFEIVFTVALAFAWNIMLYSVSKLIAKSWHHYDMTLSVDKHIPFLPWTIIIYFGCYIFWIFNYYLCARQGKEPRERFFCADAAAKIICFIIFICIPTTNARPAVADNSVFDLLMKFLYKIDSADNLFPSIHCLMSWLCWVGIRKRKDIHIIYRTFSLIFALAVCVSTLTTRQHVTVDVFAGVALAELAYFISGFDSVRNIYSKAFGCLIGFFKGNKTECR